MPERLHGGMPPDAPDAAAGLSVLRAGALTTIQDLGRIGYAHLGVPRSGALDAPALLLANRLVGNPARAAGLEITLTGCVLRAGSELTVAVAGAPAPVEVDGRAIAMGRACRVAAGATLHIGRTRSGVRTYLGVAGGIAVPQVLCSRSTDTLSGLGPAPLRDGDVLPVGPFDGVVWSGSTAAVEQPVARSAVEDLPERHAAVEVGVRLGPRDDWLTEQSRRLLCGTPYTVSPLSNRIGVRLSGTALDRARTGELESEGVVLGAVQVPPDGQPLVFLADHPTTGGYPVVAVVDASGLPALAQVRPGAVVVFRDLERH